MALYALFGFLLLPKLLNNTIRDQVHSHLGWQTEIEKIEVNPFLLTLTINHLAIKENTVGDTDSPLSFSRFHADFELRSLIEGAFTFKNVELTDPSFSVLINPNGSTNIQQALIKNQQVTSKKEEIIETDNETPSVMPKLLFDNINVVNGSLIAKDHSHGELITHKINPISFQLKAFSTYVEQGGEYQLQLALGDKQSLQWKGNIAVAPIASSGSFNIKGIRLHRFWPYIKQFSPYELRHSNVDLAANYALSFIDNQFQLTLNQAFVTFNDSQIADPQNSDHFVDIKKIKVGPTEFNLVEQFVAIRNIEIDNIGLDLVRGKNGELELLQSLTAFTNSAPSTTETSDTAEEKTSPFLWSIDNININNSTLQITDKAVTGVASIKLHDINASLSALNQSLSNKQPFSLSYKIESSQQNNFSGELIAQPFSLDSNIKLAQIPINIIQPYLAEAANISIKSGHLSLDGNSKLALDASKGLMGTFDGQIDIAEFDSEDTVNNRRLLGWKKLSVTPIKINLSPLTININEIALDKPYSRLIITEDRKVNFSQLMVESSSNSKPEKKSEAVTSPSPEIEIAKISFKDGDAYFADLSLIPQFGTSIQQLNGAIKGLSSSKKQAADVNINGSVEEYGKVAVQGEINPFSDQLYTDMSVTFDKIELTTLTPYAGRYAGYVIDKGKLTLDLNYKISDGLLDGKNRLILDQFELGEQVESKESVDLPIKLALALFKDSKGVIDISLPTKGDLNSPDFEIGGLVMKALTNVITKAVTSPFSLLASLAGGDEQSLNSVAFELGSASINNEQKNNLKTLASLLVERPELILELRVNVDSKQEKLKLQQQALAKQLDLSNKDEQQQLNAMESLYSDKKGEKALKTLKQQLLAAQDEQQKVDEKQFQQQYQQVLSDQLVILQPIETLQLSELAQQRISIIKNELITINKVDNQQVFALQPSLTGSAEGSVINTIFSLTSK
ncbi:ATPase [Psychromonas marina]|uniref:ATPase n=1 Tax=Psychromonas marina TaxID=88364 RepID=A0ABQ6E272_9GAMM|nr:ATPase [Psychromonas marina]